jgi:hypothetical protein
MAVLPSLRSLFIGFRSPLSRLQITLPPRTRAVLHAFTNLPFSGFSEYFEDFAAQIDAPLLRCLFLVFFIDKTQAIQSSFLKTSWSGDHSDLWIAN